MVGRLVSFSGMANFQVLTVSFRKGNTPFHLSRYPTQPNPFLDSTELQTGMPSEGTWPSSGGCSCGISHGDFCVSKVNQDC